MSDAENLPAETAPISEEGELLLRRYRALQESLGRPLMVEEWTDYGDLDQLLATGCVTRMTSYDAFGKGISFKAPRPPDDAEILIFDERALPPDAWLRLDRERRPLYKNHAWLWRQYIELERTQDAIGRECGVSHTAIANELRVAGINARGRGPQPAATKQLPAGPERDRAVSGPSRRRSRKRR